MSRLIILDPIGHYIGLDRPLYDPVLETLIGVPAYDPINPVAVIFPDSITPSIYPLGGDVGMLNVLGTI